MDILLSEDISMSVNFGSTERYELSLSNVHPQPHYHMALPAEFLSLPLYHMHAITGSHPLLIPFIPQRYLLPLSTRLLSAHLIHRFNPNTVSQQNERLSDLPSPYFNL